MMEKSFLRPLRPERWITCLAAAAVGTPIIKTVLPGLGSWFKPGVAHTFTLVAF